MNNSEGPDIDRSNLAGLLAGELGRAETIDVVRHLRTCPDCVDELISVAAAHTQAACEQFVSSCESAPLRGGSYSLNMRWNGTHIGSCFTMRRPTNDLHVASGTGRLRKRPNASHHVRLDASYNSNVSHPLHRFRLKRRA